MAELMTLKKAQRKQAKLKLGMSAPSGGGKTLGALLIAYGLMKEKYPNLKDDELWEKIVIIDTENGSGELYVGTVVGNNKIGSYNAITLTPPFEADKYTSAIQMCQDAGMEVAIIDSVTHLWAGQGGLLEQQGNIAKRTGNSYTAWLDVTPQHNHFVDSMMQTDMHIIATMRSKTEYVQEKNSETGKTTVRKVGLNPIAKDGMEYEFTVFLEIDSEHNAFGSKDRTGIVDGKYFKITPKIGEELMEWLETATDTKEVVIAKSEVTTHEEKVENATDTLRKSIINLAKELGGTSKEDVNEVSKKYGNPNSITGEKAEQKLKEYLTDMQSVKTNRENKENK